MAPFGKTKDGKPYLDPKATLAAVTKLIDAHTESFGEQSEVRARLTRLHCRLLTALPRRLQGSDVKGQKCKTFWQDWAATFPSSPSQVKPKPKFEMPQGCLASDNKGPPISVIVARFELSSTYGPV